MIKLSLPSFFGLVLNRMGEACDTVFHIIHHYYTTLIATLSKFYALLRGAWLQIVHFQQILRSLSLLDGILDRTTTLIRSHNDLVRSHNHLKVRNTDLEYALNLETISAIYDYERTGKLYSEINHIRKTFNEILSPQQIKI